MVDDTAPPLVSLQVQVSFDLTLQGAGAHTQPDFLMQQGERKCSIVRIWGYKKPQYQLPITQRSPCSRTRRLHHYGRWILPLYRFRRLILFLFEES
jgi:hypothetical protein